jgi:transcriptional regulator with XRE-family HTH domain
LAKALGVMPQTVMEWEMGRTEPTISRLRALTEHFGVRDDQINLKPGQPPTLGERLADAL